MVSLATPVIDKIFAFSQSNAPQPDAYRSLWPNLNVTCSPHQFDAGLLACRKALLSQDSVYYSLVDETVENQDIRAAFPGKEGIRIYKPSPEGESSDKKSTNRKVLYNDFKARAIDNARAVWLIAQHTQGFNVTEIQGLLVQGLAKFQRLFDEVIGSNADDLADDRNAKKIFKKAQRAYLEYRSFLLSLLLEKGLSQATIKRKSRQKALEQMTAARDLLWTQLSHGEVTCTIQSKESLKRQASISIPYTVPKDDSESSPWVGKQSWLALAKKRYGDWFEEYVLKHQAQLRVVPTSSMHRDLPNPCNVSHLIEVSQLATDQYALVSSVGVGITSAYNIETKKVRREITAWNHRVLLDKPLLAMAADRYLGLLCYDTAQPVNANVDTSPIRIPISHQTLVSTSFPGFDMGTQFLREKKEGIKAARSLLEKLYYYERNKKLLLSEAEYNRLPDKSGFVAVKFDLLSSNHPVNIFRFFTHRHNEDIESSHALIRAGLPILRGLKDALSDNQQVSNALDALIPFLAHDNLFLPLPSKRAVREAIKPLCRALRDGTLNNSSNSSITLQKQFQLGLLLQALLELKLITRESPFGWLRRKINNIFVNYPVFNLLIRFMVAVISFVLKLVTGYFIFHYGKNLINYCRGRKRGSSSAVYHAGYHAMVADAMSLGERGCKSNLDRGHSVTDFIRGLQTVYYQSESGHLPTFDERHLECDHHKDVVDEGDSHKINMVQGSSGVSAPNDGGHQGGDHRRSSDFCRWLYPRMVFLRKEKEYFGPDISVNDFLSSATSLR